MDLERDVKPITHLKNNAAEVLRSVSEDGRTVVITQNGVAKGVLMDPAKYDEWRRALIMLKLIALGQADLDAGRVASTAEAFARAEAAIASIERD